MGDLNEAIDRAMDAAEAKLDEKEVIQETADPVETTETPDPVETVAEKEILDKQTAPTEKPRDASGKFTKGKAAVPKTAAPAEEQVSDQVVNEEPTLEGAPAETADATPGIEPPAFWSTERKALFAKAPRELQEVIAERELVLQQQLSRATNEASRGKAFEKRLYEDMESPEAVQAHKAKLQVQGIRDEVDELHRYRAWDRVFNSNAKTGIADLMRKNGLTPYDFFEDDGQNQQQTPVNDPRIDEALQKAEEAKQRFESWQEEQRVATLKQQVESFKDSKDESGQPRRQFVELYAPQIDQALASIQRNYPDMPLVEALTHATEFVRTEVTKLHGISPKPQVQKPQVDPIAQAKKAKAAASSVTGAPSSGTAPQRPRAKSIDEAMDRAEEALGLR